MSTASLRFTCLSAALICTTFCVPAKAQSSNEPSPTWTLGIGAVWSPSPYRNYDNKAWPLPMVNYEGKSFYVRGAMLGYRLFKTNSDEFSIIASPLANRFVHDDTSDPLLRRLSDRDISGLAGVAWKHRAGWGVIQASAQKEFTGHGGGSVFDANYSYPVVEGSLTLIPTAGVAYNTSGVNNYYYGISGSDAMRSGLPFYHAGAGASPYFGIVAAYKLSRSWLASGGIRYTVLPDAIKDSPMVEAGHTQSYFVSLSYIF
ncbi:MAG: MipA/OmpV family protein [Rhodanobacter sp.]